MKNSDVMKFLEDWQALKLNGSVTIFHLAGEPFKIQCEGFRNLVSLQELASMERAAKAKPAGELPKPERKEST